MSEKLTSHQYLSEAKTTIYLAIPIVTAQLGVVLMGVSDNIMIGRMLGKQALAASGLAHSISFLIASIAVGGLAVISPIIAKHKASGDRESFTNTYFASFKLALWLSILLSAVALLVYIVFEKLDQPAAVSVLAKPFFLIISLAKFPAFFFIAYKQILDGFSKPEPAMIFTIAGLCLNIILNYILIKWMGLNGAALSTLLVRISMLVLMWQYFKRSKWIMANILPTYSDLLKIRNEAIRLFRLSIPGGLQFFFEIGAFSISLIMMGWISENALAAHQIAINIASTTYMMASGIAFAGSIRVGDALGSKAYHRVRLAGNTSLLVTLLFMSLSMIVIVAFKHSLVKLYVNDLSILALAESLLVIAAIFQLSDGIQVVGLGNLRGLSDVKIPAYITFVAYWLISIPLGYYLAFFTSLGAKGVWIGLLAGLTAAAIFLTFRFYQQSKRSVLLA